MANILLVEDDLDTRDLLCRLLSQSGYQMMIAANGWEGLLALERDVHLILLDLMLPGMDGYTFLKTLRRQTNTRHIPVVAVTALDPAEVREKVKPYGVTEVLSKNGNLFDQLKIAMDRHLVRPESHACVKLPEPGSLVRPYLDLYLRTLAWQ